MCLVGLIFCSRKAPEPEKEEELIPQKNGKLLDDKNVIETKFNMDDEQLRFVHFSNPTFWVPFLINALTLQTGLFVINN